MKRFNNILCIVEPENNSLAAIFKSVSLAKIYQANLAIITLVKKPHYLKPLMTSKEASEKLLAEVIKKKKSALDAFVKENCKGITTTTDILVGIPFIEVIRDVLKNKRDLVVKCVNQESWIERLVGSDDMHLLRKCPCPVLMLKSDLIETCQNILATVDVSDCLFDVEDGNRVQDRLNKQVLELSASIALAESANLHIGCVWDALGEDFLRYGPFTSMPDDKVNSYAEQTREEVSINLYALIREMNCFVGQEAVAYIQPKVHLVKGLPSKELPVLAHKQNADLIVMGTVARTGIPGFIIGNTAESILDQVDCSVLAIKPEGFQCPVAIP